MYYIYLQGQFKEMWSKLFNIVRIRQVKIVSGKCWTCVYQRTSTIEKGKGKCGSLQAPYDHAPWRSFHA